MYWRTIDVGVVGIADDESDVLSAWQLAVAATGQPIGISAAHTWTPSMSTRRRGGKKQDLFVNVECELQQCYSPRHQGRRDVHKARQLRLLGHDAVCVRFSYLLRFVRRKDHLIGIRMGWEERLESAN